MKALKFIFLFLIITLLSNSALGGMYIQPTITQCLTDHSKRFASIDECMSMARPEQAGDCGKLPNNISDYKGLLIRCYSSAMQFNLSSCDSLSLSEERDKCYCVCSNNLNCKDSEYEIKQSCIKTISEQKENPRKYELNLLLQRF